MGILDGIVEWIAEQVMYGLDLINTSVLGALGCSVAGLVSAYSLGCSAGATIALYLALYFAVTFCFRNTRS